MRQIQAAKVDLVGAAERDHEQRTEVWSIPVRYFSDHSDSLYEAPGHLVIDIGDNGFRYDVETNRSGSEGVAKMKIFCFDMVLMQLMVRQGVPMDFLIHDSVLYDGVDSRQRAQALRLASRVAKSTNTQYICTLNSDMIPRDDFDDTFDIDGFVRRTLTDSDPSGSLLGFQFEA